MGVKNLYPFLKRAAPECSKTITMSELRGKRIAIDGTLLLYREHTSPWLPVDQPKKHILWAMRLMRLCKVHDIIPVVIFDSPRSTAAKAKERVKRSLRKDRDRASLEHVKSKAARLDELATTMQAIDILDKRQQAEIMKQFQASQELPAEAPQEASIETIRGEPSLLAEISSSSSSSSVKHDDSMSETTEAKRSNGPETPTESVEEDLSASDGYSGDHRDTTARIKMDLQESDEQVEAYSENDEVSVGPAIVDGSHLSEDPSNDSLAGNEQIEISPNDVASNAQESTALAERLVAHLKAITSSGAPDASSELALLLKLLQPDSGIPLDELQNLQSQTAEIVDKLSRRVVYLQFSEVLNTLRVLKQYKIAAQLSPDYFEGECTASYYARAGYVDYVATDDSDALVYGVPQVRSFMSVHSTYRYKDSYALSEMTLVDPVAMRAGLDHAQHGPWSESTFRDFAILCGTDFTTPIASVGTTRAHLAIDNGRTLEAGVAAIQNLKYKSGQRKGEPRFSKHEDFQADADIARAIFSTFPSEKDLPRIVCNPKKSKKAHESFRSLCEDPASWSTLEHTILKQQGMTEDDIKVLDSPALYQSDRKSGATVERVVPGIRFHDSPDRAATNESGFLGFPFQANRKSTLESMDSL